ncbi:MAG: DHH family phosphoesterase [Deltaproteobacteria bacterium]|nr:DHH family phosphoesterase [Deltaproteobacteria bacterium]MBW2016593.1 DHH family phosphoesterase [Deltaproteobacteria bacterium]MBW2130477.1 DHH family phosphoesterase [Deltaproteobacteria bacterium]MBW2303126.1 DHH family phosphoesterase [Deltaproteobacteria bacterium]
MDQEHPIMEHPFAKSVSQVEKYKKLLEIIAPDDVLAIVINADPDAIASAMALKRLFWRRVKKVHIYRTNVIKRADNLALVRLLKVDLVYFREHPEGITRWAIVDSQPHHDERLARHRFDIIIDHHPPGDLSVAPFVDIREQYGANSSIMTEYLKAARIKPSPKLATALFYGIKTDTDNFARNSILGDIEAFKYLYRFANINTIKKLEFSEITRGTLKSIKFAIDNLSLYKDRAFIFMGRVKEPDLLVIIADFFLRMAEATWCIVAGVYGQRLIVIFRNAGFRLDAGKVAQRLFGEWGPAGGHKSAARAEISIQDLPGGLNDMERISEFLRDRIKAI